MENIIYDCDQCGNQFEDDKEECPKECPKCGKLVNFILEPDDFRVRK